MHSHWFASASGPRSRHKTHVLNTMMRVLNLVFLALYILSAAVQYNDPDPMRWIALYGAAAVACIVAMSRPAPRWLSALVAAFSIAWIALLVPRVLGQVGISEMFQERGMATMAIEEGREAIGLILVVIWMIVLFAKPGIVKRPPKRAS
jgi:hypothetical protein